MSKNLEIDMVAGSELRDTQSEILDVAGADISELLAGRGIINCDHAKGFYNTLGRVTYAKKIFKYQDCTDERQKYYWEKIKAPYIYVKATLFDADEHPHAKAAAAIMRNIHKNDTPLKMKASVEGGVVRRADNDPNRLAQTKITGVALTFTPANNATLVEPLNLTKSTKKSEEADYALMRSIQHLAKTDIPSFRTITRHASASTIVDNIEKIEELSKKLGVQISIPSTEIDSLIKSAITNKIVNNIETIRYIADIMRKTLSAGYGGAAAPTNRTGGAVLQAEKLPLGRGIRYIRCDDCGHDQVFMDKQTRCRKCHGSFAFDKLAKFMIKS